MMAVILFIYSPFNFCSISLLQLMFFDIEIMTMLGAVKSCYYFYNSPIKFVSSFFPLVFFNIMFHSLLSIRNNTLVFVAFPIVIIIMVWGMWMEGYIFYFFVFYFLLRNDSFFNFCRPLPLSIIHLRYQNFLIFTP